MKSVMEMLYNICTYFLENFTLSNFTSVFYVTGEIYKLFRVHL